MVSIESLSGLIFSIAILVFALSYWRDGKRLTQAALNFSQGSKVERMARLAKLAREARTLLLEADDEDRPEGNGDQPRSH